MRDPMRVAQRALLAFLEWRHVERRSNSKRAPTRDVAAAGRAGHHDHARAGGDGSRAARAVRARRSAAPGLCRSRAADRLRANDQPAVHRGPDDRGAAADRLRARCSRSAPAAAIRRRSWPSWPPSVVSIERHAELSRERAGECWSSCGYTNVTLVVGDGTLGWPERAPYDRIIVTAAASHIPPALESNWPKAASWSFRWATASRKCCKHFTRWADGCTAERLSDCRFVPLVGARRSDVMRVLCESCKLLGWTTRPVRV